MPMNQFSDDCPGCRPAMLDVETGKVLPDDHPMMKKVLEIWQTTTLAERQAFHRVMCQNSRAVSDIAVVGKIVNQLQS